MKAAPPPDAARPREPVGAAFLAQRLASLALEVDRISCAIEAERLTEADALLLGSPSAHFRLAAERIADALHRAERLDQRPEAA